MIIGIDFDNTIACYETIFHKVALQEGLIDNNVGNSKNNVRDSLHNRGMFDEWTALQGEVYGNSMNQINPFPKVKECLQFFHKHKIEYYIISHKTQFSKKGTKYDLHQSAMQWLEKNFFNENLGLNKSRVFFNETREKKIAKIAELKCTHFIDDLPAVFAEKEFPINVNKILFDPKKVFCDERNIRTVNSWDDILNLFNKGRDRNNLVFL